MKYKDKRNIDVIQIGNGDTCIAILGNKEGSEFYGVGFSPISEPVKVGDKIPDKENKTDYEIDTYLKLVFTNPESIDILVKKLEAVKKSLIEREPSK